jgi:hypothetical protein
MDANAKDVEVDVEVAFNPDPDQPDLPYMARALIPPDMKRFAAVRGATREAAEARLREAIAIIRSS